MKGGTKSSKWPYRLWVLLVVLVALAVSCIGVESWTDTGLQHIPTVAGLVLLAWWGWREERALSNASYMLLAGFFLLHIVGAHYLYSNVPYDDWARALTGRTINGLFGWERNCFDRLVHFSFGVLIAPVVYEMGVRFAGLRPGFWPALLAVGFVSLFGNVYEVLEWGISLVMSAESAETYNGQQGDVWDAQKDLTLSFVGSLLSTGVCLWRGGPGEPGKRDSGARSGSR